MKTSYTYWREPDGIYLGFLNDYPDHWTQGSDVEELKEQLVDLYKTFSTEDVPGIRKVAELEIV